MRPAGPAGALDPAPLLPPVSLTAAPSQDPHPPGDLARFGARGLASQLQSMLEGCRRHGRPGAVVTLTRPAALVADVRGLLEQAGLRPEVVESRLAGYAVLTLRG